ncbi:hypothetical protein [Conexibacter arvalis]|uniref:Lipoprotein n=1 Tax=Conexibacter arvalis TaxID=912552 RepID=A0A840IB26_9ACTN|nr:hypothetical protein [Conexibacter arvalis]MBB4662036.1 hypothetical protein [Conexibacter arvalis]
MAPTDLLPDPSDALPPRRLLARGRAALGVGAVALALAAAGCGGDDEGGATTAAGGGATAAQTAATEPATAAGNGVEEQSADEILASAQEAARAATAVRVSGEMEDLRLDLSVVRGEGATGTMAQGGMEFELIVVGDEVFLKGSDAFYEQIAGRAAAALLSGKWLQVPKDDDDFGSIAEIADMEELLGQALDPDADRLTKGEVEEVDGQQAIGITADRGTLYVATEGEPLPVALVGDRTRPGRVTFSGWNEPVELTAPADAIDVAELQGSRR